VAAVAMTRHEKELRMWVGRSTVGAVVAVGACDARAAAVVAAAAAVACTTSREWEDLLMPSRILISSR
jgi:hypothetical protein